MPLNSTAAIDKGFDATPDVVTDGAGLWIAAWSSGNTADGSLATDRDILIASSLDAGATWTDPAPLNSTAAADSNSDWTPRLATDGRGHWLAVWSSADNLDDTIGVDRDILVSRSSDNGRTWTPSKALNLNAAVDAREDSSPTLVTDGLGNWLVAWHAWGGLSYDDGSDADVVVAYSRDNGATWSVPMHANKQARQDEVDDILPGIATDGAGNWVALWQAFHVDAEMSGMNEWRVIAIQGRIEDRPDELATTE
jgi:Neuraminidase (sialidase)